MCGPTVTWLGLRYVRCIVGLAGLAHCPGSWGVVSWRALELVMEVGDIVLAEQEKERHWAGWGGRCGLAPILRKEVGQEQPGKPLQPVCDMALL